ncbi:MAG: DUF2652 domain-containing protein [Proteobacteria bacterium]|nr:DUF2652 domain-containing protein [Pseudomonadota bacterium]
MPGRDLQAVLLLADISGYTRFMLSNRKARLHATVFITHLLSAVIDEVREPLGVIEVEGDAVFCVAAREFVGRPWPELRASFSRLVKGVFERFERERDALAVNNPCGCTACHNLLELDMKLIVHTGEVTRTDLAGRVGYAGVDVIWAHRLLKNHVNAKRYVLFTRPAFDLLEQGSNLDVRSLTETDEELGTMEVLVHEPACTTQRPPFNLVRCVAQGFWLAWRTLLLFLGMRPANRFEGH